MFLSISTFMETCCKRLQNVFLGIVGLAEQGGQDLNPLFAELADWEAQLKPLDQRVFEKLGGLSL